MAKIRLASDPKDYKRLGITEEAMPREDGIRTSGKEGSYEWWYFDAEYTDGTKSTVVFYTKKTFDVKGPATPTVQMTLALPGEKEQNFMVSEEAGTMLNADRERCDVSACGCSAKWMEDGSYKVHYENKEQQIEYDFVLKPTVPMWRPKTGHIYFGEEEEKFFAWFVGVPSGTIEAELSVGGRKKHLKGNGYHDHNWGNCPMQSVMDHWYWCRVSVGDYTAIDCDIVSHKKYGYDRIPIFLLAKNDQILSDFSPVSIQREKTEILEKTGRFMDGHLTFQQQVGDTTWKVEYFRERDITEARMLKEPIKRFAARLAGLNPTYCRCVGSVKLTQTKDGVDTVETAHALWEQMGFGTGKKAKLGEIL